MQETSFASRMIAPLGRLFEFDGRSTRAEHWPYMGLLIGIFLIGMISISAAAPPGMSMTITLGYLLILVLILLASASVVRRLHDVGWSGRWMAAYVVLIAAFIAFFFYWRYGLIQRPHAVNQPPSPILRILPLVMLLNLAASGIGLLIFVLTVLESMTGPNRYGPAPDVRPVVR